MDATPQAQTKLKSQSKEGRDTNQSTRKRKEIVIIDEGPIPDGGYSWVIVLCQFVGQMATWGMLTTYGVFISWFQGQNSFPGATQIEFGWVAGICFCVVFGISPASNYLSKLLPLRVTLAIAQTVLALGFILAGLSTQIWQLALTQGLLCGVGIGLNFMATQPLISQWFLKHRALAMGLSSGGVGAGGLLFSFTTRLALANLGVRMTYIINGIIVFAMLTPTTVFFKSRVRVKHPELKPIQWGLFKNLGVVFLCIWAFFVAFGYLVCIFSVALYATQGLGLSQAQAASVQAIFAAGQLIGRPSTGLLLDRLGRVRMASLVTLLSGISCLCIWMFAKTYGVLLFFGIVSGTFSGIFYSALGPLLSEVVSISQFSDALSIIWLIKAPITLVCMPIAFGLDQYSQNVLGRSGPEIFQISIGAAGAANVIAALALFIVGRYERTEQDA
ncbi:hypothetical protein M408DRAFT_270914 [Serendipita vermifera MAFF 305830]|uniref:Major facilitator superfamily (MFS) profile domain-containing protein n=1 Tax=Serendipita vermifera MAFF 305830 TaxID=933852 RepID=A0A0C2WXF0_SERVB|nr:hypothetical protein M408DRAFT_270914 [Serendipita vermifera MAFF 305830]